MGKKYIALLPAYQPGEPLLKLVRKLACGFSVILVDDGSGRNYRVLFERCGQYARVLYHEKNKGKGRALKTGLSYILEYFESDQIVVTVDADGQHQVDDVLSVCRVAEENPGAFILGSRGLKENVPLRSRVGNTITRLVYRISTGVRVHDTQTGLRAFGVSMIPMLLAIPGEHYEYEMNILLQCARQNIRIREQKIKTIYIDHNSASHFDTLRDSIRIYKEILKFSASSLIGFLIDYTVYSLLLFTGNLLLANILARIISASVNFALNRMFVFHKEDSMGKAAAEYILLAAVVLLGNTLVLEGLVNGCGMHRLAAKLLTEILFFFFSWSVQKFIIFRKRGVR